MLVMLGGGRDMVGEMDGWKVGLLGAFTWKQRGGKGVWFCLV